MDAVDAPGLRLQVFAFHFPPSNASGAARPARLVRYLPEHGIQCRVTAHGEAGAAGWPGVSYVNPADARGWWRVGLALARALQRVAPYNEQLPWLAAALQHAFAAQRAAPADAVFSTYPPLAAHLAGLLFHLRFGVPWIADFRDPLACNPFRNRRWARGYDLWIEKKIVKHAAAILVTNDSAAEILRVRHPAAAARVHVLWNGFDPGEPPVVPAPALAPRRLVHAGSLYGPRRPCGLLRALALLEREGRVDATRWKVEFIGPHEPDTFAECRAELELLQAAGMVEIRAGLRPKSELEQAMRQASLLLLLDLTGDERSVQVPAKLFEYVRSGLPIVAWSPAGSPTRMVLQRAGVPSMVFGPGQPAEDVAARLAAWLDSPPAPASPSPWFLETFDGARQAAWLAGLLRARARL
ncbi:MAG: glycosyltransferase [Bryobacteraceae bacterium]